MPKNLKVTVMYQKVLIKHTIRETQSTMCKQQDKSGRPLVATNDKSLQAAKTHICMGKQRSNLCKIKY